MYFGLEKQLSDLISDDFKHRVFWREYGVLIISCAVILIGISILLLARYWPNIKQARRDAKLKRVEKRSVIINVIGFDSVMILPGNTFSPQIPVKYGFTFGGWFVDSALTVPWLSTQKVTCDTTLYPKWVKE